MPKILLTRPLRQAREFANTLPHGWEPIISPLTEIVYQAFTPPSEYIQAILITSQNGAIAAARHPHFLHIPAYCVGPKTTEKARSLGFIAYDANGTAKDLAALVAQNLSPEGGIVVHFCGADAPNTLVSSLMAMGFETMRLVAYSAQPLALSDTAKDALKAGDIDVAAFFSPRAADLFGQQLDADWSLAECHALAISKTTARALQHIPFQSIRISNAPNGPALLAMLRCSGSDRD